MVGARTIVHHDDLKVRIVERQQRLNGAIQVVGTPIDSGHDD
jgi:hypothetical protein